MLMTKIYQPDEVDQAAQELRLGELIAFPTETVYGLGADATNEQAVKRVYLAKGRPSDNPLIVTISSVAMAEQYIAEIPPAARKLMAKFWPGSLTMVFKIKPGSLSKTVTGGLKTAAFRMPQEPTTLRLIEAAGVPLVGPSANTSGKPSPTTAQHVFNDLEGRIAGIVDDGPTKVGVESTILDMSVPVPTILRPGAVTVEEIEAVLGMEVVADHHHVGQKEVPKAPGMKYKHYAPAGQVVIVAPDQWEAALKWAQAKAEKVGVMVDQSLLDQQTIPANVEVFDYGSGIANATHKLFAGLRYFDGQAKKVNWILVAGYPEEGLGAAYMNRLRKSAGNVFFSDLED